MKDIKINVQSSIRINNDGQIIYFDPFKIDEKIEDADVIFITHDHYDHFDTGSIANIRKDTTIIVMPEKMKDKENLIEFDKEHIKYVTPNKEYSIENIKFETVPSYNVNKNFHPKSNGWTGYILYLNDGSYYISGDTDSNEDILKIKVDYAFVPIGGTYTMTYLEAAELINNIKPRIVIPTHYGSIVGSITDGEKFKNLLDKTIECRLLIS